MKVALLAGGTGGTKLAHGFAMLGGEGVELSVIANVGDDTEMHGLLVCPDIDALLYTLAGLIDTERGWGVADDTYTAHLMFARYGEETWFTVGDADLATHAHRTRLMADGATLTAATATMSAALGIGGHILPATDARWRTLVATDGGELAFQEYFVRLRQQPEVRGVRFESAAGAPPPATAHALRAVADADLVIIGPSNPIVSIGPILELEGMRSALAATRARKVAVSPIVAGRALKGPADRMLASLGHEVSAVGVARLYAGLVDRFVLDEEDADIAPTIGELGMKAIVLPTVMRTDADRAELATALLALAR